MARYFRCFPHRLWDTYKAVKLNQLFVYFVILIILWLGPEYQVCWSSVKKTCNATFKIGEKGVNMDYEGCKRYCNEDKDCKFIFLIPIGNHTQLQRNCIKYRSCEDTRIAIFIGTTYSKEYSCPGNISIRGTIRVTGILIPYS